MNENLLEAVIANPPKVHQGDAELGNEKALTGSSLTGSSLTGHMREMLGKNLVACHGIDSEVARFLHRAVAEGARTLETGSGLSTIIFAMRKAHHTVVTPSAREAAAIREYARANQIGIERVNFILAFASMYPPGSRPCSYRRQARCPVALYRLVLHSRKAEGRRSVRYRRHSP